MENTMSKRIAVVGAGPGGLSAAMLLSANGYDVTVYEAATGRSWTLDPAIMNDP